VAGPVNGPVFGARDPDLGRRFDDFKTPPPTIFP
jgi:hypothetical protein